MKILLTGANGYIGMRLKPQLLGAGHQILCAVRNVARFSVDRETLKKIEVVEIDFLKKPQPGKLPKNIDTAYFLIHFWGNDKEHSKNPRHETNFQLNRH